MVCLPVPFQVETLNSWFGLTQRSVSSSWHHVCDSNFVQIGGDVWRCQWFLLNSFGKASIDIAPQLIYLSFWERTLFCPSWVVCADRGVHCLRFSHVFPLAPLGYARPQLWAPVGYTQFCPLCPITFINCILRISNWQLYPTQDATTRTGGFWMSL
jgi:hypothetical protein